ncbi:type II toxin-antitoxin system PemK/MazF family toxin [Corynebacterium sp. H127]|uniref:type II toxin-antitoxin system PemK/MazF family toxin n=1 Tax=Corynebacterium sp. H127 TaxID=3133418 RepID=UPI00309A3960
MREICLANLDKTRPVVVLTRELARPAMMRVTVAPITTTIRGLSSEVVLDQRNGLDHRCACTVDNTITIPSDKLGKTVGFLTYQQETLLAQAMIFAFDLDVPLPTAWS